MSKKKQENQRYDISDFRKLVGKRVKALRESTINPKTGKKYSQEDFAELLEISKNSVNNLETGYGELKLEYLYRVKEVCGCDIGYLLGEYDCKTRVATDICKETGLSEAAANFLTNRKQTIDTHKQKHPNLPIEHYVQKEIDFINHLLNDEAKYSELCGKIQYIIDLKYISNSYIKSTDGEAISKVYNLMKYEYGMMGIKERLEMFYDMLYDEFEKKDVEINQDIEIFIKENAKPDNIEYLLNEAREYMLECKILDYQDKNLFDTLMENDRQKENLYGVSEAIMDIIKDYISQALNKKGD